MKLCAKSFVVMFLTAAVPAFAIEYGSVMDSKIRTSNSMISDTINPAPAQDVSVPPETQTMPAVNAVIQDALGTLANPPAPQDDNAVPAEAVDVPAPVQEALPAVQEPSSPEIRVAIQKYVADASQTGGTFNFQDQAAGRMRKLILVRINDPLEKGARGYLMNADFSDIETGDLVNLKFELFVLNSQANVIGIQMNTVNGQQAQQLPDNQLPQTP